MLLYRIGITAYHTAIGLAAKLGNRKAAAWVSGRKPLSAAALASGSPDFLRTRLPGQPLLWMHAASLGEFEQGRPVLDLLRKEWPDYFFLLTFYSPSGYEAATSYPGVDALAYLPKDEALTAQRWVASLTPTLAIFIKYEFWLFHLAALREAGVPTFLIAATFRPQQPFFKWYGAAWRRALSGFTQLLLQTPEDATCLKRLSIDLPPVQVVGDPRLDRVLSVANTAFEDPILAHFTAQHNCWILGSVWPEDVALLIDILAYIPNHWRLIVVPHQLEEKQLAAWENQLSAIRYSHFQLGTYAQQKVLLLDKMGLLSRAYRYAQIAYVGGGFGQSIHNTLEPMAYWLPIIFGPKYHKFPEAVHTLASGGSFTVRSAEALLAAFEHLQNPIAYALASKAIQNFTASAHGAATKTATAILAALAVPPSSQS